MMLSNELDWSRRQRLLSTVMNLAGLEQLEPRTILHGELDTTLNPVLCPPIRSISRRFFSSPSLKILDFSMPRFGKSSGLEKIDGD